MVSRGGGIADGGRSDRRKQLPLFPFVAEVERYYRKAKEILAQNQDFLEKMASALVDRGLLLTPDIQEVKNNGHIVPYTRRDLI